MLKSFTIHVEYQLLIYQRVQLLCRQFPTALFRPIHMSWSLILLVESIVMKKGSQVIYI
jgi:hypothetical protein